MSLRSDLKPTAFEELLSKKKVKDIATQTDIARAEGSRPLKDILQILKEKNLQSLFIYEGDNFNDILGFVDVLDITSYALSLWKQYERSYVEKTRTKFSESKPSNIFLNTPVRNLINFSGRDSYFPISENSNLIEAFHMLNSRKGKARRLPVRKDDGTLLGVLCNSDITKFLKEHLDILNLSDMKLRDLNMVNPCLMVRYDIPMYDALNMMVESKVSGIALVDWEFNIVANFSASDLKGLLPDAFDSFWMSTLDFLRQGTSTRSFLPPRTCLPTTNFRDLVNRMVETPLVHRIFITTPDRGNRLEGIVSMTDVLTVVIEGLSPAQREKLVQVIQMQEKISYSVPQTMTGSIQG